MILDSRKNYYLAFSALFIVCVIAAFWYVYATGHCLIWSADGLDQHYTFFAYIGQWLREWFSTGTLPMWNYTMGYGADNITAMASWIGEPFNLLSALCPTAYSEYLFQALIPLRMFLAGIAFSAFCRYHKQPGFPVLVGSILYCFSGYALAWGAFRHPMFIDPAILLPMVLLGADKIMNGERPVFFLVSIALAFFVYFYFAYMIGLFLLLFCLLRYFTMQRDRSIKDFLQLVGRFVLYCIVGFLAACVLLLPILMTFLNMGRLEVDVQVPFLRQLGVYLLYPIMLVGGDSSIRGMSMGAIAVFAVLVLYVAGVNRGNKETRPWKIAFAVLAVFAIFPFFSHVFNGFSYVSDRWMFGLSFCMAYIVVLCLPQMKKLEQRDWKHLWFAAAIITAWMLAFCIVWYNRLWVVSALVVFLSFMLFAYLAPRRLSDKAFALGIAAFTVIGIGMFSYMHLASPESESASHTYLDELVLLGQAYNEEAEESGSMVLNDVFDETLWRYDKYGEPVHRNNGVLLNQMSISYYSSVYNQQVDTFRTQLALSQNSDLQCHHYSHSDSRTFLEAVSGVKYFLVKGKNTGILPYGYTEKVAEDTIGDARFSAYEAEQTLPLAYTYDSAISTQDYEAMSPIQRQNALLQGCIVDDVSVPATKYVDESKGLSYTVSSETENVTVEDNIFIVTEANQEVTFTFEGVADSETYLYLENLNYKDYFPSDLVPEDEKQSLSFKDRVKLWVSDNKRENRTTYPVAFINEVIGKKTITCDTSYSHFYGGKHTWLINVGYSAQKQTTLTLQLKYPGEYSFDDLKILSQPMGDFASRVERLNTSPVQNLSFDTNKIAGTVSLDAPKLVYLSTPWSSGWRAYVDGEEAPVKCANTAFMAIEMQEGSHSFELRYETPYLRLGCALSLFGVASTIVIAVVSKRRCNTVT